MSSILIIECGYFHAVVFSYLRQGLKFTYYLMASYFGNLMVGQKIMSKSNLQERVYFGLQLHIDSPSLREELKQGRKLETRTGGESREEVLSTGLLSQSLRASRTTSSGMAPLTERWVSPHPSLTKKIHCRVAKELAWWRHFIN